MILTLWSVTISSDFAPRMLHFCFILGFCSTRKNVWIYHCNLFCCSSQDLKSSVSIYISDMFLMVFIIIRDGFIFKCDSKKTQKANHTYMGIDAQMWIIEINMPTIQTFTCANNDDSICLSPIYLLLLIFEEH